MGRGVGGSLLGHDGGGFGVEVGGEMLFVGIWSCESQRMFELEALGSSLLAAQGWLTNHRQDFP